MKILLTLLLTLNLIADNSEDPTCQSIKRKISFYEKLENSQTYTGDFKDVVEQYKIKYNECLINPDKFKSTNIYRNQTQQTVKSGYLF